MQARHTPHRFLRAPVALLILSGAVIAVASRPALSRSEFQPIDITTPTPITPGQPLECDVTLTGGPATVTVYSDPPGAVCYSGTVSGASAAIQATTSADIDDETVTVYVKTDGATSVATLTPVDGSPGGYPGG